VQYLLTGNLAWQGLSAEESSWRNTRLTNVVDELKTYLPRANISSFNVTSYISKLNASNAPVVGLAISGGGTQSGLGGLGLWQALDARYPPAVVAGTGGLQQCLSYLTGLSGGGFFTVATIASNNFTSVSNIRKAVNFSTDYEMGPTGNQSAYYGQMFENAGAKAEEGFPVSVTDIFGQMFRQYLPPSWAYKTWSDIAGAGQSFTSGQAPMPIVSLAEVVPGKSPNIHSILYPGNNATNVFNLTSYEVSPFEFGSWMGGRVQAFFPTKWLGTLMKDGKPQNKSQCVQGFDQVTFIQGSTANAFNFWFIDAWYNIPLFAKRSIDTVLRRRQSLGTDIVVPPSQESNPLVQLVNGTVEEFDQTFNASMWATWLNPFQGYNKEMKGVEELLLVCARLCSIHSD
jgi:lysophospholipase